MLRQLLSGLFRCVNPQVILVSIIIAVNVFIITVLLIITKVGNWEGGEVEEYNRAITASRSADADDAADQLSDDQWGVSLSQKP